MWEVAILYWVARDKLTKITASVSTPAGNCWHTKVGHWRSVSRETTYYDVGRMERNHRDGGMRLARVDTGQKTEAVEKGHLTGPQSACNSLLRGSTGNKYLASVLMEPSIGQTQ